MSEQPNVETPAVTEGNTGDNAPQSDAPQSTPESTDAPVVDMVAMREAVLTALRAKSQPLANSVTMVIDAVNAANVLATTLASVTGEADAAIAAVLESSEDEQIVAWRNAQAEADKLREVAEQTAKSTVAESAGDPAQLEAEYNMTAAAAKSTRSGLEKNLPVLMPNESDRAKVLAILPTLLSAKGKSTKSGKTSGTGDSWRIYGFDFAIDDKPVSEKIGNKEGQKNSVAAAQALSISLDSLKSAFATAGGGTKTKDWPEIVTVELADKDGKTHKVTATRDKTAGNKGTTKASKPGPSK